MTKSKEDVTVNSKKTESINNVVVSSSVLADLFGVTNRYIRKLAEEGVIEKVKRGRYDLVTSVKNYIIHVKTNIDIKDHKDEIEIDYEKEKALHEKAKREKAELELAAMRGTMHYSEDVDRVMSDMLANFRSRILSMPSKLAPTLIARNDIAVIQEFIKKECSEVLEELSQYDPSMFYSDDYIELENTGEYEGDENASEEENTEED